MLHRVQRGLHVEVVYLRLVVVERVPRRGGARVEEEPRAVVLTDDLLLDELLFRLLQVSRDALLCLQFRAQLLNLLLADVGLRGAGLLLLF